MSQYPRQGAWGQNPAPGANPGRGRLIALTVALAVLLIGGSVGVTLAVRNHRAAPEAKTVVVSSTMTSTSVVTETSTSVATRTSVVSTTVTPPTSPARVIGKGTILTTPTGPQVTCANRTTAIKGTCTSYSCWDKTMVTEQRCPALAGLAALTWIYRPSSGPTPNCALVTDKSTYAAGELEKVKCNWSDLPQITVYLSRWKDVASSLAYLGGNYGAGTAWTAKLNGKDERQGVSWNLNPIPGKNMSINAELYDRQPYSLLAIITDPNGAGKGQWDTYFKRQGLEFASRLDLVVASTK